MCSIPFHSLKMYGKLQFNFQSPKRRSTMKIEYAWLQTFLNVIRPHVMLPKTQISIDFCATISKGVNMRFALRGKQYQANWSYISLICSKAPHNRCPNSHMPKIATNDQNISTDITSISSVLLTPCRKKKTIEIMIPFDRLLLWNLNTGPSLCATVASSRQWQQHSKWIRLSKLFRKRPNNRAVFWKRRIRFGRSNGVYLLSMLLDLQINCSNFEWNRTNWMNCLTILDRFFLRFAISLMIPMLYFISLVNVNSIEHVPNPKSTKHLAEIIKLISSIYCIEPATKNPSGFFVSNGKL